MDRKLFEAAASGDTNFLRQTEAHKLNSEVTPQKNTVLHIAVKSKQKEFAKQLLGRCPSLLRKADLGLLDLVNTADQSPLSLAVLQEFPNIVLHILETSPSSPCGGTNGGINALHFAAFDKRRLGLMEILVKIKPEMIKEADKFERTPLHYAALRGDLEAIRLFLQCDRSAAYLSDKDEMFPLHLAAYAGHVVVARELFQWCPDIWESLDEKGRTALHVAVIAGKERMVKYILGVPELVGLINEPDKEGNTPLHLAAVYQKYTIISILAREERVDKQAMNNEFFTAIDIFASKEPVGCNLQLL